MLSITRVRPLLLCQDAARDLVHRQAVARLLELDEDVVPAEREPDRGLELGVEDVRQRQPALEEHPPGDKRLRAEDLTGTIPLRIVRFATVLLCVVCIASDAAYRLRAPTKGDEEMTEVLTRPTSSFHRPHAGGCLLLGPRRHLHLPRHRARSRAAPTSRCRPSCRPNGGPPPHIHRNEDETFYVARRHADVPPRRRRLRRGARRLRERPEGHRALLPQRLATSRCGMILTFTPAGIEKFFEETLERALRPDAGAAPTTSPRSAPATPRPRPRYGMDRRSGHRAARRLGCSAAPRSRTHGGHG